MITYGNAIGKYQNIIKDILASRKYIKNQQGESIKKRNGYKIVHSKNNDKLYINMEKLLNEMIIVAAIDGNVIYRNRGDLDTINILTKRYNPKKKYSKLSIQIFNDLHKLSGMVKNVMVCRN